MQGTTTDYLAASDELLKSYDILLINSSAGKDSLVMLDMVCRRAQALGILDRVVVVHCDLGRVEWAGTRDLAERQAAVYGVRFEVVARDADLLEQILERQAAILNLAAEIKDTVRIMCQHGRDMATASAMAGRKAELKLAKIAKKAGRDLTLFEIWGEAVRTFYSTPWPSSATRYCTSDQKTGQVIRLMTRLTDEAGTRSGLRILNLLGLRADESTERAKKAIFTKRTHRSNSKRTTDTWLPIHTLSDDDVWAYIRENGLEYHQAYDLGMSRLSCCFCVMANEQDLRIAADHNQDLLGEYAIVERRVRGTFTEKLSIQDLIDGQAD